MNKDINKGKIVNNSVETVDYYSNGRFSKRKCSFHWWEANGTSTHTHTFCEFFIITDGRTRHIINGEEELLEKNILYFIRAKDVHRFVPQEGSRCIHMNISVGVEKLASVCAALGADTESLYALDSPLVKLSEDELSFFLGRARELNICVRAGGDTQLEELIISEMLCEAVSALLKNTGKGQSDAPEWFTELLRRLNSPECSDFTAAQVCELAGYSAPALVSYFKRYTGLTIAGYLIELKTETAKELLTTTSLPILEISGRLGYDSLSHFNHLFKSRTGKAPGEYRRSKNDGHI